MSNKQDSASEDAVADERRLAAHDARDVREAASTTSALPANRAVAAESGADAASKELSANFSMASVRSFSTHASPSGSGEVGGTGTGATLGVPQAAAPEPEYRASAQDDLQLDAAPTSATGVGARLMRLREAHRWSIEDVSTRLKVPTTKLRAIEAGDLSALPDLTFTLGVIRAYAKLLGVDSAPLTAVLRQSSGPVEQDLSMPASRGGGLPRGGKMSTMSWNGPPKRRPWLWAIGAVVLAVVVLLLYRSGTEPAAWLAKLKQNAETANPASAAANASAAEAAASSEVAGDAPATGADGQTPVEEGASDAASLSAASTVSASTSAAQTLAAVSAAGPNPVVTASAANLTTPTASTPANATAASAPSAPPVPAAGQSSIHISVTQDSWVSVRQADGKEVMSGLLHAGDPRDAVGTPPLQFVIGNRTGLESLEVNGSPVDPSKYANAKGNVARFSLP
ncbi:helix-turn-helix domain-containing protein [Pararobbsia alpina]|uniref:Cytoskeleton protein RodZ n=1 Tax=Pararobbsia alpina TaxID=621374 RepID=A0A6S7BFP5_9BURK|nr:helix-turn-helix domain-containing protein [Pararobbsia alpina]CAB3798690.1 Cytoskeleton protein RodZ [Pararobbsia alpina]